MGFEPIPEKDVDLDIIRFVAYAVDPLRLRHLLHENEFMPGILSVGDRKLYPKNPELQELLVKYLKNNSYDISNNARYNPENPLSNELTAKINLETVQKGIECGSCKTFIEGVSKPKDMECCPSCAEVLYEAFPPKGLCYPYLTEVRSDHPIENEFEAIFSRIMNRERVFNLNGLIEDENGEISDIQFTFKEKELPGGLEPTIGFIIDHYDREKGLVYCYVDQTQVTEEDLENLKWNRSTAEKSFRTIADSAHGNRLIFPVGIFKNYYSHSNFREVKRYQEENYDIREQLPVNEEYEIYEPWAWNEDLKRSYVTWVQLVGMTEDIGWYSTDHPKEFTDSQIRQIVQFLQNFLGVEPRVTRGAIGGARRALEVIKALAKFSGEAAIHNPNWVGATFEGERFFMQGKKVPPEQIAQEMIFFTEEIGESTTLEGYLKKQGIDLRKLYEKKDAKPNNELKFYQDIWDSLDLSDNNEDSQES